MHIRSSAATIGLVLATISSLTACGNEPEATTSNHASTIAREHKTAYPLHIDNCGFTETFNAPPKRVVILNGASVAESETLIKLGLGGTVVANAQHWGISDEPGLAEKVDALPRAGAPTTPSANYSAEQILNLKPDLVLSTFAGGFSGKGGSATRQTLASAGIKTIVTPTNCALGAVGKIRPADQKAHDEATVRSSFNYITLLGKIFDVPDRASALTTELNRRLDAVQARIAANKAPTKPRILIAIPGMSAMNANGLPAVMTGGIYDSIINAAGGQPVFHDPSGTLTSSLSAEQLAAANVDVLVIGQISPTENPRAEAEKIFAQFPQWSASKTRRYVAVSDGIYLGPTSVAAVEKIERAAYLR